MRHPTVLDVTDLRAAGAAMLGVALVLRLSPVEGIPCPLRSLTGVPCPLCGMTTSVAATVHGDLVTAVVANPAGLIAVGAAVWLLATRRSHVRLPGIAPVFLLLAMWFYELFRFSVLMS